MAQKMHIINSTYAVFDQTYTELQEAVDAERSEILKRSELRIGSEKSYRIEHHFSEADEERIEFLRSESSRLFEVLWNNPHPKVLCGSTSATKNGRVRTGNKSLWAVSKEAFNSAPSYRKCVKCCGRVA